MSSQGSVTGHHSELGQEAARGGEGEDPLALQVGERMDRVLRREMAGIPGAGRDVLDADLLVLRAPDIVEAVLVEEDRHVERVARCEREVAAEDGHLGRRGHGIVVGLHRVDGAALHGAEELAGRNDLIGKEQLDLHPLARDLVEHVDRRLDHVLSERGAGIGLHPPRNLGLRNRRSRERAGRGNDRRCGSRLEKIAPCCHESFPFRLMRQQVHLHVSFRKRNPETTRRFPEIS